MDMQPTLDNLTPVIGGVARAVGQRAGEAQPQQAVRTQAAAQSVMDFEPRDAVEGMIAGHCVMFHEMIVDSVRTTLGGETVESRRATRNNIIAMDKAFGNNLTRLRQYRAGVAADHAKPVDAVAETEIADRVRRHRPESNRPTPAPPTAAAQNPAQTGPVPTAEQVTACLANPEAMAALRSGDAAGFARALGIAQPSEAYIAAASEQMAGFNRQPARNRPEIFRSASPETGQPTGQANP